MDMDRDDPDTIHPAKSVFGSKPDREKFEEQENHEYLQHVDQHIDTMKKRRSKQGLAFIIKYIGAWYIMLAIFKGLFWEFSPSFDIIGLVLFVMGTIFEHLNAKEIQREDYKLKDA